MQEGDALFKCFLGFGRAGYGKVDGSELLGGELFVVSFVGKRGTDENCG
jgi:hypothetical protein